MPTNNHTSAPLAAVLQPFVDRHELAGAVALVADDAHILDLETIGFADIASGQPMQPDSHFWIASQSKAITAAAVMMLVDEGKIHLDDPVAAYLPEFTDQWLMVEGDAEHQLLRKPAHSPTVRHLLSNTSGLPFCTLAELPTLDQLTLRVAARTYAMAPLQFEPGSQYMYANAGFNTAGRILELVSGIPFADFLDQRLFAPLGMTDTTFWPNAEQLTRLATSYKPTADGADLEAITISQLTYPLDDRARQPMPAGGLFSTAADVARFCQMLLNRGAFAGTRYLSEAAIQEMTRKQTCDAIEYGYGFGLEIEKSGAFSHGGAHSTNMAIDPARNLTTVYLLQHAGFPGDGGKSHGAFRAEAERVFGK